MADTAAVRTKTRRVKDHILDRYLKMAEKVDMEGGTDNLTAYEKGQYQEMTMTFAKAVIPRAVEVTGEDGGELKISFDPVFKKDDPTPEAEGNSTEPSAVQDSQSGA